ncbi:UNVERIFIED_CONTAM: hypothetical protein PYX00_005291 [Menopon gallinae]|uniref:FGGY carbohydrate kinase domain-containing protein n=1 Tax=Menopon gallinae TaxID=328185 RepID=A0AAW2HQP5_9NEOP
MENNCYIGVDVGTGSVRAALVCHNGEICRTSTKDIKTWNPKRDFYEQSSNDIWKCCCEAIKEVSKGVDAALIKGIGFDATCSLVVIGEDDGPLTVSPTGEKEQNIILWMDHRAKAEAEFINRNNPEVLKYTGGSISLEMQTPKLMWLKKNANETWKKAKYYFDLADYLTWKATGDDSRSLGTVVYKWTYINGPEEKKGWSRDYFSLINLEELLENDAKKIGNHIRPLGENCGNGLTETSACEMGLQPGTPVATGLIDAHAGALGLLGSYAPNISADLESRIVLICGTSTCHMIVSKYPVFVTGVWGPYCSALIPGMWLNEAGQSATGKLIDYVILTHPAASTIEKKTGGKTHIQKYLNDLLKKMAAAKRLDSVSRLTSRLHVWPDFHGNRSPLADPTLLGMMSGLSLACDEEDLALKYLSVMQSLVTRGFDKLETVLIYGGLSKNQIFVQSHADILGVPVLRPKAREPVLLGAAMVGSIAAGGYGTIEEAMYCMAGESEVYQPNRDDEMYHSKKYEVFLKMVEDQRSYDTAMAGFTS